MDDVGLNSRVEKSNADEGMVSLDVEVWLMTAAESNLFVWNFVPFLYSAKYSHKIGTKFRHTYKLASNEFWMYFLNNKCGRDYTSLVSNKEFRYPH
jgi:hypothetical protein